MSKLIVTGNSLKHIYKLIKKDIFGVMLYLDKLSVNGSFYVDIDTAIKLDCGNKQKYLVMNKIMHNSDLVLIRDCLEKIRDKDVKILFYDMAVYNIAKELGIISKLVIYQDH